MGQDFLFLLFTGCLHGHAISICKSDQVRVSAPRGTQISSGMTQMGVLVWHLHMAPEVEETSPSFRTL